MPPTPKPGIAALKAAVLGIAANATPAVKYIAAAITMIFQFFLINFPTLRNTFLTPLNNLLMGISSYAIM
jgi:hypothetical protein